ncbi:MAG: MaoC family dehydratase [Myxococcota bacterium]
MTISSPSYGRRLDDFEEGAVYPHPWEVTLDWGLLALTRASFLDAAPVYASAAFARELGFREHPVPPVLLLNLGLSFSVHDISEQAIAHLAYLDVYFPNPCYVGDTVRATSKVLGKKPSSAGDKGVVHVRTVVENQDGVVVCSFERKALIRAGAVFGRPKAFLEAAQPDPLGRRHPVNLDQLSVRPGRSGAFAGFFEDFEPGKVYAHQNGKTIGESEHMQLTLLYRNSHPIHFDEEYCRAGNSFKGTRVVYGGLVFATIASLASRDVAGNSLWDMGFDAGAHPGGVVAGDTLFAASQVLDRTVVDDACGDVTFRLVGTRNVPTQKLLSRGVDLFTAERDKSREERTTEKVFEITRTLRVLRRPTDA